MPRYSEQGSAKRRSRNLSRWCESAALKHGKQFGYSEAVNTFQAQKGPEVHLYCRRHRSWFWATPFNHLRYPGGGCQRCESALRSARLRAAKQREFEDWYKEQAPSNLEIISPFNGMTKAIKIRCKIHDTTKSVLPTNIMHNGNLGCTQCAYIASGQKKRVREDVVKTLLADRLPSHIKYVGTFFSKSRRSSRIRIQCEFHGPHDLSVADAKRSRSFCKDCAALTVGYADYRLKNLIDGKSRGWPTILALMEVRVFGLSALKVGITTRSLEKRYSDNLVAVFLEVTLDEIDALVIEARIKRLFAAKKDLRVFRKGMRKGERWSGDTELYLWQVKDEIKREIVVQTQRLKKREPNYPHELQLLQERIPNRAVVGDKDFSNRPIPVVGVAVRSGKVVCRYESIAAAERAGYRNISTIINGKGRQIAGGLRWFKEEKFDEDLIPKIKYAGNGKPVMCVDTGEVFHSSVEASNKLAAQKLSISANAITRAARGDRRTAGGLSWSYLEWSHEEVDNALGI